MSKAIIEQAIIALLEEAKEKGIRPVDAAIETLLQAAREESVNPVEAEFLGLKALTLDERILLGAVCLFINFDGAATSNPAISEVENSEKIDSSFEIVKPDSKSPGILSEDLIPAADESSFRDKQIEENGTKTEKVTTRVLNSSPTGKPFNSTEGDFTRVEIGNLAKKKFEVGSGILGSQKSNSKDFSPYSVSSASPAKGMTDGASSLLDSGEDISKKDSILSGMPSEFERVEKNPVETIKRSIYLKNAKVNEPYSEIIDIPDLSKLRLIDDGGTGLCLDEEVNSLSGWPSASGDFVVRINGLLAGRLCELHANLAVIPDPRSLWISKPHDPTAPFAKDDEDSAISRGDLFCVAASKRGRSHAREGLFRDDDFALWTGGAGGWNIAVVADGAGSAKYSRRGSQLAVRTIVRDLPQLLDEHLSGQIDGLATEHLNGVEGAAGRIKTQLYLTLAKAAFNAAMAISVEAEKVEDRASAFSTTLVLTVARRVSQGWFIAGFSIGDGGAAVFDLPSKTVVPLTLADSGEFAGQTRFLQRSEFNNGDEVAKRLFFDVRDSFTAVLAMTDGITDPKFPTDSAFASSDIWRDFWETELSRSVVLSRDNPSIEQELLSWLDFWSPGNHDDRTIAIMFP